MTNISISVILDKKAKSQKLINNRPGYDMKYVNSYILNYYGINDYQQFFEELFETERQYNTLSLVSERKKSVYHIHALFLAFSKGKFVDHNYYRPRIYKTRRYVEILEPKDLMQEHWDHDCNKPKTRDSSARIIQNVWRRFQEREPSNARLAWNSLANDNTLNNKKFLGLTRHKVKNSQTREQFNQ
ncbi:7873_t:CDS:2 [Cetraspora pellucida]|uniref:7873_t:CDS:1 n=1 Tax=Cetraspora pellucida TaxID=1433469 RepID=A0A9N9NC52_9GLOM|nr:7873_t:CDS:2 [Cetraspora pellucida]